MRETAMLMGLLSQGGMQIHNKWVSGRETFCLTVYGGISPAWDYGCL